MIVGSNGYIGSLGGAAENPSSREALGHTKTAQSCTERSVMAEAVAHGEVPSLGSYTCRLQHAATNQSRWSHQIEDAWNLGYTGQGVVVSVLDDGIDYNHEDLAKNYVSLIGMD